MEKHVIIVAGGVGKRMNKNLPKQFICIHDIPIIFHTINKFHQYDSQINIIIALQDEYHDYWNELTQKHKFNISCKIVSAGKERFHTVKNALESIGNKEGVVAIHDAVRPMVSNSTIASTFSGIKSKIGTVPVIELTDSIRKINDLGSISRDRKLYKAVQTPQCFILKDIYNAYQTEYSSKFTDDASVFETLGNKIILVEGNIENIKITNPIDLIVANHYL